MGPVSQLGLELPLIPKSHCQGRSSFKNSKKAWPLNSSCCFVLKPIPARECVCLLLLHWSKSQRMDPQVVQHLPLHPPSQCSLLACAGASLQRKGLPSSKTPGQTQPLPKLLCGCRWKFCSASEVNTFLTQQQRWASLLIGFGKLGYSAFPLILRFYVCPAWGCAASSGLQYLRGMNTGIGQILLSWRRGCIQVQLWGRMVVGFGVPW